MMLLRYHHRRTIITATKWKMAAAKSKKLKEDGVDSKYIALICDPNDEAVRDMPEHLKDKIMVSNDIETFDPNKVLCVVWKPPGKSQTVDELFEEVKQATGSYPTWLHSFYAGVDALGGFLKKIDTNVTKTTNGRGAFSSSLAEFSLAAMLHFNKQIPRLQQNYTNRYWDPFTMDVIQGKTVGFLGYGSIGQSTAKLLSPFGVTMIATKKNLERNATSSGGVTFVSKLECANRSDFIINALPSTPETKDFANAEFFSAMKPTGVFINVGRGTTVDEDALADALESKRIAGAALDVFKKEPLDPKHRFYELSNILLSNHNADHTIDYIALGWKVFEENFEWFLDDFKPDGTRTSSPTFFDPKTGY
jgi:phosphoglycerate dehydrogenase-like enzyme